MIEVIASGSGTAYVDNPTAQAGEDFTLYAYPDIGAELVDIVAIDANGYYIAMAQDEEYAYTYNAAWGAYITIFVTFSGGQPPTPRTPWWLIMGMKKNNERGLKPYVRI